MTLRAAPRARRRALTLAVLLGGASALAVSGAHAQDAAELEELVVTAQKRTENLQDVPISITAVTADSLARSQITTLGGLQTLTPNFQVSDNVSVRTVYIRGVGGGVLGHFGFGGSFFGRGFFGGGGAGGDGQGGGRGGDQSDDTHVFFILQKVQRGHESPQRCDNGNVSRVASEFSRVRDLP